MKKIFLLLIVFCMSLSVFAANRTDKMNKLMNKIVKMEFIQEEDVPFPFDYEVHEYKDQEAINVFYTAKSKHEKNPNNFAAAYNYAMLISRKSCSEGYTIFKEHLEEAYKILEHARKINPNYLPLYQEQERVIDYRLFADFKLVPGPVWDCLSYRMGIYAENLSWAQKRLNAIKNQARLGAKEVNYLEAAILCLVLGNQSGYESYLQKAGEEKLKEEIESSLYNVLQEFSWSYSRSESWVEQEADIKNFEGTHLNRMKKYFGKYLPQSEAYRELDSYLKKCKTEIAKKRNQDYAKKMKQEIISSF